MCRDGSGVSSIPARPGRRALYVGDVRAVLPILADGVGARRGDFPAVLDGTGLRRDAGQTGTRTPSPPT